MEGTFDTKAVKVEKLNQDPQIKKQKSDWDDELWATDELYGSNKEGIDITLPIIPEDEQLKKLEDSLLDLPDDGFKIVGTNGKVSWDFIITCTTTNKEINEAKSAKLLHAVAQVKKQLNAKIQQADVTLGSKEMAKQARQPL